MKTCQLIVGAALLGGAGTHAAEPAATPASQRQVLDLALQAQQAALRALQNAYAALNATDSVEVERAMKAAEAAAADARSAADAIDRHPREVTPVPSIVQAEPSSQPPPRPPKAAQPPSRDIPTITGMIKAGQANSTASLGITLPNYGNSATPGVNDFHQLTLSAPIGKGGGATRLGTLDGLADGAKLQYSYIRRWLVDVLEPDGASWGLGVAPEIGSKQFTYNDPATFTEKKATRTSYGIGVAGSYQGGDNAPLLYARYGLQRKYEEGKAGTQCRPNAGNIECLQGPLGGPQRKMARVLTLGTRYQGAWYALNPTVNYDHASGVKGVDFPVYLFGAGDKRPSPLSGGVGTAWRSDDRNFTFYVFVGSPLEFWGLW